VANAILGGQKKIAGQDNDQHSPSGPFPGQITAKKGSRREKAKTFWKETNFEQKPTELKKKAAMAQKRPFTPL